MSRTARIARTTAETDIFLCLELDGAGRTDVQTGMGLLDHMLTLTAFWGGFDLTVGCKGDLHVDAHHSRRRCRAMSGAGAASDPWRAQRNRPGRFCPGSHG